MESPRTSEGKAPFDLEEVLRRVREEVRGFAAAALEAKLPRKHWVELNRLLVPFGKHVCTGTRPRCGTCPVLSMCQQVGVSTHR